MTPKAVKQAVVTGASSGIGAAIAARLLAEGWQVTGISRSRPDTPHPAFRHLALDLAAADPPAIAAALGDLAPDAFIHAAGLLRIGRLGAMDPASGTAMWQVHVQAAETLANILVPRMAPGSRIVLIGSRTATGSPGRAQYAATKAALVGLARSWAAELAPQGITVNVVSPGATDTPMLRDPARAGAAPRLPPLGRFVRPGEVAATVAFLLGEDAGAITGQQITICGGASL